jgi:site-specific DNA-methyltransferase (adenine-specific)
MTINKQRKGTKTSSFGSPGRIGHDSSSFYASKLYEGLPKEQKSEYIEIPVPNEFIDKIFVKSSEFMSELSPNSIHLMVTSPPYNVGKDYDNDLTLEEYRSVLKTVWAEVYRVLVPGGRACINVANLGRKPYLPLNAFIHEDMFKLGFLSRGEIIWNKATSVSPSTAWGTFASPVNPVLRDIHEYILIYSKGMFKRENPHKQRPTILDSQFLEWTKSVWTFSAERASKIGHPAPFPVELPHRLIQLYTFENDIVLDPFMGSGQTAIAAIMSGRHYIGYEIEKSYVDLSVKRIKQYLNEKLNKSLQIPLLSPA